MADTDRKSTNRLAIIGIIITAVFGIPGIIFGLSQIRRQRPTYTILPATVIADASSDVKLLVTYEGKNYDRVSNVDVIIWNNGRKTIRADDISSSKPLKIVAGEGVEIIKARITAASRSDVFAIQQVSDTIQIELIGDEALEWKDGLRISLLVSSEPKEEYFYVEGRIFGTAGLQIPTRTRKYYSLIVFLGSLILMIGCATAIKYIEMNRRKRFEQNKAVDPKIVYRDRSLYYLIPLAVIFILVIVFSILHENISFSWLK